MDSNDATGVLQFWNAYAAANGGTEAAFTVWSLGDTQELASELAGLVTTGTKRAKSTLLRDLVAHGTPVPKVGDFSVILDGNETPRCITRTVQVEIKPLNEVDARFAWLEGEGDRSLDWWLSAHVRYFKRQGAREGFAVNDRAEVVLVQFEVVWPPEFANLHPQTAAKDTVADR